jgi:hypothetical protein
MSAQTLVRKQFVSYWDLGEGRAVIVDGDAFTSEMGYTQEEIEDIRRMDVDDIIEFTQKTMLHKIWRVK